MVPLAGIEPALLAELDFESSASTSSATGALARTGQARRAGRTIASGVGGSTGCDPSSLDSRKGPRYERSNPEADLVRRCFFI